MNWTTIKTPDFEAPIALHHADGSSTVVATKVWYGALTMARWAGWVPEGTTLARGASRYRYGYLPHVPGREQVAQGDDLAKLAAGIRTALERSAGMSNYEREVATIPLEMHAGQPPRVSALFATVAGTAWSGGFGADPSPAEAVHDHDSLPWLAFPRYGGLGAGETAAFAFHPPLRTNPYPPAAAEMLRLAERLERGGATQISDAMPQGWYPPSTVTARVEVTTDRQVSIMGTTYPKGTILEVPQSEVRLLARAGLAREVDSEGRPIVPASCPTCGHAHEVAA